MPWMLTRPTQPLASKDHWGLQRHGLLGGGLPECLQPRRGSITEDFLLSSLAAHRLPQTGGDRQAPTGIICLPLLPRESLPFRCPLCQGPLLHRAWEKGTGKKQAVRLVWLVTNTAGLLPACPPCGPRGACGLLAPALPALCPAHPCIPASSHLSPSLGSVVQGWEIKRRGTSEAQQGCQGHGGVRGARGENEMKAAWGAGGTKCTSARLARRDG